MVRVFLGRANSTGSGLCGAASLPHSTCVCVWVCSVRGSQGHTLRQNGHPSELRGRQTP